MPVPAPRAPKEYPAEPLRDYLRDGSSAAYEGSDVKLIERLAGWAKMGEARATALLNVVRGGRAEVVTEDVAEAFAHALDVAPETFWPDWKGLAGPYPAPVSSAWTCFKCPNTVYRTKDELDAHNLAVHPMERRGRGRLATGVEGAAGGQSSTSPLTRLGVGESGRSPAAASPEDDPLGGTDGDGSGEAGVGPAAPDPYFTRPEVRALAGFPAPSMFGDVAIVGIRNAGSAVDPETDAFALCVRALTGDLTDSARRRILEHLVCRFVTDIADA